MLTYPTVISIFRQLNLSWEYTDFGYAQISGNPLDFQTIDDARSSIEKIEEIFSILGIESTIRTIILPDQSGSGNPRSRSIIVAIWLDLDYQ